MRISRPCYDKPHRCPWWAGGGWRYPRVDRCEGGYIRGRGEQRAWEYRFHRCPVCNVLVLPYASRWFDPTFLRWCLSRAWL